MIIERIDALKSWLVSTLSPICDADPDILAKYVLALIKKDKPIDDLISKCRNDLDIFLQDKCDGFVDKLFMVLRSGEFGNTWTSKTRQPVTSSTTNSSGTGHQKAKSQNQVSAVPGLGKVDSTAQPAASTDRPDSNSRLSRMPSEGALHGSRPATDPVGGDAGYRPSSSYGSGKTAFPDGAGRLERKRKLSPPPRAPSPRGRRSESPSRRSPARGPFVDRLERRPNVDIASHDRRYSPAPVRRRVDRVSRSRSRSNSRSRPLTRRRSRSWSSGSSRSGSASSSTHPKRIRRTDMRPSPDRGRSSTDPSAGVKSNRCQDYEERGFCVRGDLCPYDHGTDPVVLDDVGLPSGLCFQTVTREIMSHCPPPPPGIPTSLPQGLPDVSRPPLPSMQFHPNLPPAAYLHPPPMPGSMLFPPGVMPPRRLVPPPHAIEPYLPEPFAPKMSVFQPQILPPAGYSLAGHGPPPLPVSSAPWGSAGNSQTGYGLVQQSRLPVAGGGDTRGQQPPTSFASTASRHGNLVVVPTMHESSASSGQNKGQIKVSDFILTTTTQSYTQPPSVAESKPVVAEPVATVTVTTAAPSAPVTKKPIVSYEWQRHPGTGVPWVNKSKNVSNATLELRRVPPEMNTIAKINEHFARFGTLVNLQVAYGGDPEAALVSFASHAQASAAYHCSEPMFNNRFIKIFWHNSDRTNQPAPGGPGSQAAASQVKLPEAEPRLFPPAHQLQLNNKRNFATAASSSVPAAPVIKAEPLSPDAKPFTPSTSAVSTIGDEQPQTKRAGPPALAGITAGADVRPATVTSPSASSSSTSMYIPPRPGSMKLNSRDQMKKDVIKKRLELHKQKQSLLERQIQQQKLLLQKLEKSKKMSAEEKTTIVDTIKKLATSVDKLKTELAAAVGRLPAATGNKYIATSLATKTGELSGAKASGSAVLLRPTKLVRNVAPPTVTAAPVVTSASTTSLAESETVTSSEQKTDGVTPTPAVVNEEPALPKKISESETAEATDAATTVTATVTTTTAASTPTTSTGGVTSADNTSLLRQRVAALKREAASLGLLSGPITPHGPAARGRGIRRGFAGPLANRTFDRRPRQLLVTGFTAENKEDVLTHLMTFGAVDSSIIDTLVPSISIKYKTRQSAENAVAEGSVYKGQQLTMAWQGADGMLSPKIIPPTPPVARPSTSFHKPHMEHKKTEETTTKTVSKLLEDDSDEDEDLLLGGDDDDDDDTEGARSWRR